MRPLSPHLVVLAGLLSACGGSRKEAESPNVVVHGVEDPGAESVPESVDTPLTQLARSDVNRTVDAGLGQFLQEVELEGSLVDGKFEGFRIVRFQRPQAWLGVGLMPGDVIVSINEAPIEHPEQAYALFVSLKTAAAVDVVYHRQGKTMRLSLPIVGESPAPAGEKSGAQQKGPAPVSGSGGTPASGAPRPPE